MKTKYILLVGFLSVIFLPLYAATHTGDLNTTISYHSEYVNLMDETWNITAGTAKPLVINYTVYTESGYDFVTINNVDNNGTVVSQLLKLSGMQSGQITTQIPNGRIQVVFTTNESGCYANNSSYYNGITISFSLSNNQVIDNIQQVTKDIYLLGKVGIGKTNPTEKLDVEGNAIINGRLGIGGPIYSNYKIRIMNTTDTYSIYNNSSRSSTSTLYGFYSTATNSLGNVYGIYSSVSGQTGKKWAGYFTGGDVAVMGGNVGIGTSTPKALLDVAGGVGGLVVTGTNIDPYFSDKLLPFQNSAKLILGWNYSGGRGEQAFIANSNPTLSGGFSFYNYPTNSSVATHLMTIAANGKVGIGTTKPTDLLSVNGIIRAKEVKIDLCEDLADYVFKPSYKLMPLHEVEQFVKTNSHLPEIPSAAEVQKNGLSIGEMQNKLLQKIEELTLYVIEQQKQIEDLKLQLKK